MAYESVCLLARGHVRRVCPLILSLTPPAGRILLLAKSVCICILIGSYSSNRCLPLWTRAKGKLEIDWLLIRAVHNKYLETNNWVHFTTQSHIIFVFSLSACLHINSSNSVSTFHDLNYIWVTVEKDTYFHVSICNILSNT